MLKLMAIPNAGRIGLSEASRETRPNQELEDQFCPPPGETMMSNCERINTIAMALGGIGVGLFMNSNGIYIESAPFHGAGLLAAGAVGFESIRRRRYRVES